MFWKIVGGIATFFMVVVLAVALLATVSLAAFGSVVGAVVEDLDISTVQVTDAGGKTETYDLNNLISESGRIEVTGDNGERVTINLDVPQITVQESGDEAARVVIGGGSGVEINADVPQIRIDGRSFDNFDGSFVAHSIAGFFRGLFSLMAWTLILVGIWLVLRNRQPGANMPQEKTPSATA